MKQYLDLLKEIKSKGTWKDAARENMPKTCSLFGYQFRHNLQDGFPLLTTKKLSFKNIVTELLWFLKGDTNIKYLVDNGCNIWNEDAYNYYLKLYKKHEKNLIGLPMTFENFVNNIKTNLLNISELSNYENYKLGDCGKQYGWLWRSWEHSDGCIGYDGGYRKIDQIKELIDGLKNNPMSRRHIINAWNPVTLDDMALNACHVLVQFNCRPLTARERENLIPKETPEHLTGLEFTNTPQYYLDCQMYQRSADVFLG